MRFQFSLAELLALTTIVGVGLGLCPLWKSSPLATGVSVSLLVGSVIGCVIGICYGRVSLAVLWGILSSLLGTAGWLVTHNHDSHGFWPLTFSLIAFLVSVPSASVAVAFNRPGRRELFLWPCVNCFAAFAALQLLVFALLLGGAVLVWVYDQPWQGPGIVEIIATIPLLFVLTVIVSVAWGAMFGALGLAVKGIFFLEKLGRDYRQRPRQ